MLPAAHRPVKARASRNRLPLVLAGGAACLLLRPALSRAYSVEVDATVIGQGYTLSSADLGSAEGTQVDRRRLTTYLGLYVGGLGRKDRDGLPAARDQFSVTVQLRVDSDFGDYLCSIGRAGRSAPLTCRDPGPGSARTDPELGNYRPELLFAYAEGHGLGGWVDVRLGRQVLWDLFDLRGLDGGWLSLRTPFYFALEAWGGVSQNGALPIDPPLYVLDGTSRDPYRMPDDPRQQFAALQPTVGASLRTNGLRDVQGRLSYRRTFSVTQDLFAAGCTTGSACAPTSGTIEERLSYTLHGRLLGGRLHGFSGLRYDLVSGRIDDGQAGVRGSPRRGHNLGAEYRYSAPTWDGDSIFNVFSAEPYHHVQVSYDGRAAAGSRAGSGDLSWHARAFTRLYRTSDGPSPGAGLASAALGGDAGLGYRRPAGLVRMSGYCDGGYGGLRAGADLSGRLLLLRDTVGLEGRVMYLYFADDERDSSRSHGVSLQAGVRWAILRGALLHVLAENNVDRFYNSQLRLLALLDLSFLLGPRSEGRPPAGLLGAGFGDFPAPGLLPGVVR